MLNRFVLLLSALATLWGLSATAMAADAIKPGGVIIFGGSGRTGVEIAKLLLAKGETVTVFARPSSDLGRIQGLKVTVLKGDAMSAVDVAAAFAMAKPRIAINAIAGRGTQTGFWDTTQKNITAAAKKNGSKELIFLSSVGVGDSAVAYTPEAIERTKEGHAERLIAENDVKASGLNYVVIRTGIIAPNTSPTGKSYLTEDPKVLLPVSRPDLAVLTVNCIENPSCRNKTFAAADDTINLAREQPAGNR